MACSNLARCPSAWQGVSGGLPPGSQDRERPARDEGASPPGDSGRGQLGGAVYSGCGGRAAHPRWELDGGTARQPGASCRYGTQAAGSSSTSAADRDTTSQGIERGNCTRNNNCCCGEDRHHNTPGGSVFRRVFGIQNTLV